MTLAAPIAHRRFAWMLAASLLAALPGFVAAHGDEDHGADEHPAAPAAPDLQQAAPRRLGDGGLWVPKPAQHRLGVRTVQAKPGPHAQALTLNGRVIADPNAAGKVQASQAGRILPGPRGLPLPGQAVQKGQILAYLEATTSSLERSNQVATLAELDAQAAVAERKLARYEQLQGAIPQKDIEAARFERDALRQRRSAIAGGLHASEPLRAPVSGVIVSSALSQGQLVDTRELLFEVADPARWMVEALAYEPAAVQGGLGKASAELADGMHIPLQPLGVQPRLRDQAMPLLFRVQAGGTPLAIGQAVKVTVATSRTLQGVALPREALVRNAAGDNIVWLHTQAEQFSPRLVQWQPLGSGEVVVTSGLQGGERVVVQGASLLSQIR